MPVTQARPFSASHRSSRMGGLGAFGGGAGGEGSARGGSGIGSSRSSGECIRGRGGSVAGIAGCGGVSSVSFDASGSGLSRTRTSSGTISVRSNSSCGGAGCGVGAAAAGGLWCAAGFVLRTLESCSSSSATRRARASMRCESSNTQTPSGITTSQTKTRRPEQLPTFASAEGWRNTLRRQRATLLRQSEFARAAATCSNPPHAIYVRAAATAIRCNRGERCTLSGTPHLLRREKLRRPRT